MYFRPALGMYLLAPLTPIRLSKSGNDRISTRNENEMSISKSSVVSGNDCIFSVGHADNLIENGNFPSERILMYIMLLKPAFPHIKMMNIICQVL